MALHTSLINTNLITKKFFDGYIIKNFDVYALSDDKVGSVKKHDGSMKTVVLQKTGAVDVG